MVGVEVVVGVVVEVVVGVVVEVVVEVEVGVEVGGGVEVGVEVEVGVVVKNNTVNYDDSAIRHRARTAARRIMAEPLLHTVTTLPGTQTGMNAAQEDQYARIIAEEFTTSSPESPVPVDSPATP